MARILRGEIRWVGIESPNELIGHEQGGRRPALVLSSDQYNDQTKLVVVALITRTSPTPGNPYSIPVESVKMPQPSWILTGQIRTLSIMRMGDLFGTVSTEEFSKIYRAIFRVFGPL